MGLTMLRLLLLPVFLWLVLADQGRYPGDRPLRWVAIAVFGVMALTDKLDGYLARKLNQTSRLGALLDPVADKLLVACSVILLSFDWVASAPYRIPLAVVAAIYGGYVFVALGTLVVLAVVGRVSVAARPLGKLSTVLQLALVMLTLVAPELHASHGWWVRPVLRAIWWLVPAVALATCVDYAILGVRQFRASLRVEGEPAPANVSAPAR
jgi:CDP-diacylglycerol--glycerol-3-phosphate 3-phosphatidyltransferase